MEQFDKIYIASHRGLVGSALLRVLKEKGYINQLTRTHTEPDGTPRKLLDVSRLKALGWQSKIGLEAGIKSTYDWFCQSGRINE